MWCIFAWNGCKFLTFDTYNSIFLRLRTPVFWVMAKLAELENFWPWVRPKTGNELEPRRSKKKPEKSLTQLNHFSPKLSTLFLQTALANKPWILQIFPYSKFEINRLTDWKVMAKKLTFCWLKVNFLAITFQSVNRLISNFEYGKI